MYNYLIIKTVKFILRLHCVYIVDKKAASDLLADKIKENGINTQTTKESKIEQGTYEDVYPKHTDLYDK